jgi:hypothetical protein
MNAGGYRRSGFPFSFLERHSEGVDIAVSRTGKRRYGSNFVRNGKRSKAHSMHSILLRMRQKL